MAKEIDINSVNVNAETVTPASDYHSVLLSHEELQAVESWRRVNNIPSTAQAMRELIRLGLLSEISKSFDVVTSIRRSVEG